MNKIFLLKSLLASYIARTREKLGWSRNQTRIHVNPLLGHDKILLAFVFGPMGGSFTMKWINILGNL